MEYAYKTRGGNFPEMCFLFVEPWGGEGGRGKEEGERRKGKKRGRKGEEKGKRRGREGRKKKKKKKNFSIFPCKIMKIIREIVVFL